MKQRKNALPALLLLAALTLPLTACGASSDSSMGMAQSAPAASNAAADMPMEPMEAPMAPEFDGVIEENYSGSAGGGSYYENTKIIQTADLSLQTTDFDTAVAALDALVDAQGGYYESSEYTYGGYYSSGNRWGYFVIRVPKEHYNAFLAAVGDVAHLVRRTTSTQDVGEAYYDAELHLSTLNTKHERLLALLDQATEMEDIIALESALSDVEYQIQQYSSTLTRYDGLIDFATIHLDLQEVVRVTDNPTEADPLSTRIGSAFSRGWNNFCDGMANFTIWAAYHFMELAIFLAIIAIIVTVLVRKLRKNRKFAQNREINSNDPKDDSK